MSTDKDVEDEELLYYCQGLGQTSKEQGFILGDRVQESLRGISAMLRKDDPATQEIHIKLGNWEILETHILPLLIANKKNGSLVFACVKLLVRLTMESTLEPGEPAQRRLWHLQQAKHHIIKGDTVAILALWLSEPLSKHPSARSQKEKDLLELFITLFKNILQIPNPDPKLTSSDLLLFLHDRTILKLYDENILDIFVMLASQVKESLEFRKLLLDSFSALFKLDTCDRLFLSTMDSPVQVIDDPNETTREPTEHEILKISLMKALNRDQQNNRALLAQAPSRHSRFGTLISTTDKHTGRSEIQRNVFRSEQKMANEKLASKHGRKGITEASERTFFSDKVRVSLCKVLDLLMDFTDNNTGSIGNSFCQLLFEQFSKQVLLPADYTNFYHLVSILIGYYTLKTKRTIRQKIAAATSYASSSTSSTSSSAAAAFPFNLTPIKDLVKYESYIFATSKITSSFDLKPIPYGDLTAPTALLKEITRALFEALSSDQDGQASEFCRNIFTDMENIDLTIKLLKLYLPYRNPPSHLTTVVHCIHYCTKIMDILAGASGTLRVLGKKRKRTVKRSAADYRDDEVGVLADAQAEGGAEPESSAASRLDELNQALAEGLITQEQYAEELELTAETAAAAVRSGGGARARAERGSGEVEENLDAHEAALGVSGAADADSGSDIGGSVGAAYREGEGEGEEVEVDLTAVPRGAGKTKEPEANLDADGEMLDEENTPRAREKQGETALENADLVEDDGPDAFVQRERWLSLNSYFVAFSHPLALHNLGLQLSRYHCVSQDTVTFVVRIFEKLAFDLKLHVVFYQLSLFQLFETILRDARCRAPEFARLRSFCKKIVRKFFDQTAENPLLFVEVFFWKNLMKATELANPQSLDARQRRLEELEAARAERLEEELAARDADDTSEGEVELRPVRQTGADGHEAQPGDDVILTGRWSTSELKILTSNFPLFKGEADCMDILASMVPGRTSKQVLAKLKALGMVAKKTRGTKENTLGDGADSSDGESTARPVMTPLQLKRFLLKWEPLNRGLRSVELLCTQLRYCLELRAAFPVAVPFAIVPLSPADFVYFDARHIVELMRFLGFTAPSIVERHAFWRIPEAFSAELLSALLPVLENPHLPVPGENDGDSAGSGSKADSDLHLHSGPENAGLSPEGRASWRHESGATEPDHPALADPAEEVLLGALDHSAPHSGTMADPAPDQITQLYKQAAKARAQKTAQEVLFQELEETNETLDSVMFSASAAKPTTSDKEKAPGNHNSQQSPAKESVVVRRKRLRRARVGSDDEGSDNGTRGRPSSAALSEGGPALPALSALDADPASPAVGLSSPSRLNRLSRLGRGERSSPAQAASAQALAHLVPPADGDMDMPPVDSAASLTFGTSNFTDSMERSGFSETGAGPGSRPDDGVVMGLASVASPSKAVDESDESPRRVRVLDFSHCTIQELFHISLPDI